MDHPAAASSGAPAASADRARGRGRRRRSKAFSMPTERRIRPSPMPARRRGGGFHRGVGHGRRMSDQRFDPTAGFPPGRNARGLLPARRPRRAPPSSSKESMAPKERCWRAASSWPGWLARPGRETWRPPGGFGAGPRSRRRSPRAPSAAHGGCEAAQSEEAVEGAPVSPRQLAHQERLSKRALSWRSPRRRPRRCGRSGIWWSSGPPRRRPARAAAARPARGRCCRPPPARHARPPRRRPRRCR